MPRFRKKPAEVEVEAVQWTGNNEAEMRAFAGDYFETVDREDRGDDPDQTAAVRDPIHRTWVRIYDGHWVVKGAWGKFYPVAAGEFVELYEAVR